MTSVQLEVATLDDLLVCACDDVARLTVGVTPADILGRGKRLGVAKARKQVYRLLRQWGLSFSEIGRVMDRDHTTVLAGCAS